MKFERKVHGRGAATEATLPAAREEWRVCGLMNADNVHEGEYVPRRSIWIKDGIQPRTLDMALVERYASAFADLPPIVVQRDTFALIGGRHRLEAASEAFLDYVRIIEVDVADEDLAQAAFEDNLKHGQPYTLEERRRGLEMLLQNPAWRLKSGRELSRYTGLARQTVQRILDATVAGTNVPARSKTVGQELRERKAAKAPASADPHRARSFDPGADGPGWDDDPGYDPEDNLTAIPLAAEMAPVAAQDGATGELAPEAVESPSRPVPANVDASTGEVLASDVNFSDDAPGDVGSFEVYLFPHKGPMLSDELFRAWIERASAKAIAWYEALE